MQNVSDGNTLNEAEANEFCISDDDDDLPTSCRTLGRSSHVEIPVSELEVGEIVGRGGTAKVFQGKWRGELVAIKEVKSDPCIELKLQIAFKRELAVLSKCYHPNLCRFRGACLAAAPLRLVTEICAGGSLWDFLHVSDEEVELSWSQKSKMCSDVAHGMNYLHTSTPPIIHRDLKSLNLLLFQPIKTQADIPQLKITDFGTARIKDEVDEWQNLTKDSGTFHWMAPEVNNGEYDEKADVYSYAMVIYEIIARQIPFKKLKSHQVVLYTMKGGRPDLETIPADCLPCLLELMKLCWDHTPSARPSFAQIIESFKGAKKLS